MEIPFWNFLWHLPRCWLVSFVCITRHLTLMSGIARIFTPFKEKSAWWYGPNHKMSLTTVECFDPHRVSFYLNQSKALRRWPWASDLKYLKSLHKVSVSTTRQSTFLHFKTFYRQEGLSLYEVFYLVLSKSDKMFRMSGEIWSLICHLYLSEASVIP